MSVLTVERRQLPVHRTVVPESEHAEIAEQLRRLPQPPWPNWSRSSSSCTLIGKQDNCAHMDGTSLSRLAVPIVAITTKIFAEIPSGKWSGPPSGPFPLPPPLPFPTPFSKKRYNKHLVCTHLIFRSPRNSSSVGRCSVFWWRDW